jgi:hypothetical protein
MATEDALPPPIRIKSYSYSFAYSYFRLPPQMPLSDSEHSKPTSFEHPANRLSKLAESRRFLTILNDSDEY